MRGESGIQSQSGDNQFGASLVVLQVEDEEAVEQVGLGSDDFVLLDSLVEGGTATSEGRIVSYIHEGEEERRRDSQESDLEQRVVQPLCAGEPLHIVLVDVDTSSPEQRAGRRPLANPVKDLKLD